jgi:hypothetical protein
LLWDAGTGEQTGPAFEHAPLTEPLDTGAVSMANVTGAIFNHDESRLLSWGQDNTARL